MALISSKTTEDKRIELEIKVGEEVFAPAVERIFKKRSAQLTLPGFRKGKAPRKLIVQTYGMGAFIEDAVNELYPIAYNEAVIEAGIEPVDMADINITEVDDNGFTFMATVAVKPEAELGKYKGLEVTKVLLPVDESTVDEQIAATQERNARMVSVEDRAAQDGDIATIDFEGFIDDVPFEGGKGEAYPLTLGSGSFIPGFEDQVIGHKVGESFDVNVSFPEEYGVDELNGKAAVFKVTIHELKQKELPELDDEFAKDVSEFDTFAEYRADIKSKLEESAEQNADSTMENDLLKDIVADMKVDVPRAMIERRIDELVRDFENRLQMQGLNMENFLQYTGEALDNFRMTFAPQAEQQVLTRLALEAVAKAENVDITDEEVEAEYTRMSEQYGMPVEQIKAFVANFDLKSDLACNRALEIIKSEAKVTVTDKVPAADTEADVKPAKKATKKTSAKKAKDEDGEEAPTEEKKPKGKTTKAKKEPDDAEAKPKKRTTKAKKETEDKQDADEA